MDAKTRTGKSLSDMKPFELLEEYKKINEYEFNYIKLAMELSVIKPRKNEIEIKCREFKEYKNEIANIFIKKFL